MSHGKERAASDEPGLSAEEGRALARYARAVLEERLAGRPMPAPVRQAVAGPVFDRRAGVFVTLTKSGALRGCIGTLVGVQSIRRSVAENAVNAALHDYRFPPVTAGELADLRIEVSVLSEPEPLVFRDPGDLVSRLRPGIDGVILEAAGRRATFLPQVWEQLPRAEDFLSQLCRKAGLAGDCWRQGGVGVQVYQVQKFGEDG